MQCSEPDCSKTVDRDGLCFRCRVKGVGVTFHGGAVPGRNGWNRTTREHMEEHFGTADDRELGKRGIERV